MVFVISRTKVSHSGLFPYGFERINCQNPLGQLMGNIDYINDLEIFTPLWRRACECMEQVAVTPASELLHFDSSNLGTQIFRDLIRSVAAFNGTGEFAVIVSQPGSVQLLQSCILASTRDS